MYSIFIDIEKHVRGSYLTWKTWKIGHFTKIQGKPGIVRELLIIFIQVREKSGKTK